VTRIVSRSSTFALAALLVFLVVTATGCGRRKDRAAAEGPVGGADILDRAIAAAIASAEPDGDVLVVAWTSEAPPPRALFDLIRKWRPYGLVSIGLNADLWRPGVDRGRAIAAARKFERDSEAPMHSLMYDGSPADLYRRFEDLNSVPFLTLIDTRGKTIWSDAGFGALTRLDALLRDRIGEPPVAMLGSIPYASLYASPHASPHEGEDDR